jgi:cellulose biosynthesis protein BcsQ
MKKFIRSKQVVFCNNKGGVGKTTLAYNCAKKFAEKGYKTVLVDLDPQCNLTLLALGDDFYEENLFSHSKQDISDVLSGIVRGGADIDMTVPFIAIRENLSILPGSLNLTLFEDLLANASFNLTASGQERGFVDTSALDRFLRERGMNEEIDIFVIDTSPNLGLLNRVILLGADYFLVPLLPDAFSMQGIENLGVVFERWKKNWKNTALAMAGEISKKHVLAGDGLFIGYILNSFRPYKKKMMKRHQDWKNQIPEKVKQFLSLRHCRNGLVERSWQVPLGELQEYGALAAISQSKQKAIFELTSADVSEVTLKGTHEVWEKSKEEFESLSQNILDILERY